ncbi:Peptidase A1 [Cucumis melo var. makuwa]|uniref:Peptidase A1 n=1 Tax=Cucumis melo var. makuwa TaxID=1194695 RepID=A0A5A7V727_CUCMM|nr:Peptidase A1 [Cucumis melo var. makuwa]TYK08851.1 Peptidase A1 [Cucumis melo var. makuwa]
MGEEAPEKTLRELYEPDVHHRPIGIVILSITTNFHLRSNLISNLSIFRGSNGEDPHKHLRDFSWACDLLRPHRREVPKVISCGVCDFLGEHNDQCPELKEVSAIEGFRRNDSQSNTYNSGRRDHPILAKLSEHTVNSTGVMKNDIEIMKASIFELGDKLNQLATYILKMEGKGKLPI